MHVAAGPAVRANPLQLAQDLRDLPGGRLPEGERHLTPQPADQVVGHLEALRQGLDHRPVLAGIDGPAQHAGPMLVAGAGGSCHQRAQIVTAVASVFRGDIERHQGLGKKGREARQPRQHVGACRRVTRIELQPVVASQVASGPGLAEFGHGHGVEAGLQDRGHAGLEGLFAQVGRAQRPAIEGDIDDIVAQRGAQCGLEVGESRVAVEQAGWHLGLEAVLGIEVARPVVAALLEHGQHLGGQGAEQGIEHPGGIDGARLIGRQQLDQQLQGAVRQERAEVVEQAVTVDADEPGVHAPGPRQLRENRIGHQRQPRRDRQQQHEYPPVGRRIAPHERARTAQVDLGEMGEFGPDAAGIGQFFVDSEGVDPQGLEVGHAAVMQRPGGAGRAGSGVSPPVWR